MKDFILIITFFFTTLSIYAQTVENGVVKEYHGKEAKSNLSGVELMVTGAPSTVSDVNGEFSLKFSTLKPGDKVDYSEIYKEGYIIFNKDALDAWRISSKGNTFIIVMCKEVDFRALKKKFYGIIEKSYRSEYERQKAIAERNATDAMQLRQRLQMLEKEYDQKMSDINTYVELFSRIDRNEMDSIEAKALDFMEAGEIDKAIQTYEKLHLEKNMKEQFSKWDAADEMYKTANSMKLDVQSDLVILADKMQKQISLYRMGGYQYNSKKYEMIDNLIALLYRLKPVTGNQYNETLGSLLVERSEISAPNVRLRYHKEAATLPSVAGLIKLAGDYESKHPNEELIDSIRYCYNKAFELNNNDSIFKVLNEKIGKIPDGIFINNDGNKYPYKICGKDSVILCSYGPYFSTHIEGEVRLPDNIKVGGNQYIVVGIGNFAFGKNYKLRKVYLPKHCEFVGSRAFAECDSLSKIEVNASLDSIDVKVDPSIPIHTELEFPFIPEHLDWIIERLNYMQEQNDSTLNLAPMVEAIASWAEKNNQKEYILESLDWLVNYNLKNNNFEKAILNANRCKDVDRHNFHKLLSDCYYAKGEYGKAIKEGKKSLNELDPNSYNRLAYLYMWGKNDYVNAHRCADSAILLAQTPEQKAGFLDSKGEIFLNEGNFDRAHEYLNIALECDSTYHTHQYSNLFRYFNPNYIYESEENRKRKLEILCRERNVALTLMAIDYVLPRVKKLEGFNMDSIRSNVLESMAAKVDIENMDQLEIVFKNAVMQIGTHLYSFATERCIPFNNEWLGMLDSDNRNEMATESEKIFLITSIHEVFKNLPCSNLLQNDVKRLYMIDLAIKRYAESLDFQKQEMFKDLLAGKDLLYMNDQYQYTVDMLRAFLNVTFEKINDFIQPTELEINPNIDDIALRYDEAVKAVIENFDQNQYNLKKKIYGYIDIVTKCAKLESSCIPEYENFIGVPYEELVSIGIIAVNAMLKNKTTEQLKKYSIAYIATAIRLVMRNEMKIRYPWYSLLKDIETTDYIEGAEIYEKDNINFKELKIRLSIYKTLIGLSEVEASLIPTKFDFEKELNNENEYINNNKSEINSIVDIIKGVSNELSGDTKKCYDYIFSSDFHIYDFWKNFSANTIDNTLKHIKRKINEQGFDVY